MIKAIFQEVLFEKDPFAQDFAEQGMDLPLAPKVPRVSKGVRPRLVGVVGTSGGAIFYWDLDDSVEEW